MTSTRLRALCAAAFASLGLAGLIYANQPAGWLYVEGYWTGSTIRVDFSLTYREPEADYVELVEGRVTHAASCRAGTLTEINPEGGPTISRSGLSNAACFELATNPILGPVRMAEVGGSNSAGERIVDGRAGTVVTGIPGWAELVIDSELNLPLLATDLSGKKIEWHYTTIDNNAAPASVLAVGESDETYITISSAAAAEALGVESIPLAIGTVEFETAFTYIGGRMKSARTYVIWSNPSGQQVQVIIGQDPPEGNGLVISDMGDSRELNVAEGSTTLKIFATDPDLFREVVIVVRPDYVTSLQ